MRGIPDDKLDWSLLGSISESQGRWQMHVKRYGKNPPKALVSKSKYPTKKEAEPFLIREAMQILARRKDQSEHRKTRYLMIPITELVSNPIQPSIRTSDSALEGLMIEIEAHKLHGAVVVMRYQGKWVILDGHRRKFCCEKLGYTEIYCEVTDSFSTPEAGFMALNKKTRKVSGKETFMSWAMAETEEIRELVLKEAKGTVATKIRLMVSIVGKKDAIAYGLRGIAPEGAPIAKMAREAILKHFPAREEEVPTLREIVTYIVEQKAQADVKDYAKSIFGKLNMTGKSPPANTFKAYCNAIKGGINLRHALTVLAVKSK